MAIHSEDGPFIAFRGGTGWEVETYRNSCDVLTRKRQTESTCTPLLYPTVSEPIGGICIQAGNVHLCPTAVPLPFWTLLSQLRADGSDNEFLRADGSDDEFHRRTTYLPDSVEAFPRPSIGRAIACHHHHMVQDQDLNAGAPTCLNAALELMIARDELDSEYPIIRNSHLTRKGAYLLKALDYSPSCVPFDMDRDYPNLEHLLVAELADCPIDDLSSIGLKLAVSPRAYRIAIAHWRTLFIYSLDPKAFLDPGYGLPLGGGVPGDYAYIQGCGWHFYRCGEFAGACVILKPVKLECTGVIFGLEWRNEDELWGWTEEGVVRWNIGVGAKGRRGKFALEVPYSER
jgi:hypothetical protein